MKKMIIVLALFLIFTGGLFAIPNVYYGNSDGWMLGGFGLSISLPDGGLSFMMELDVGAPQQFGMGFSIMMGERWLLTLNLFYLIDPAPGSIFAIPIELKGGIIRLNFDDSDKTIEWGLGLSTGARFYAINALATDFYITGDVRAAIYWNFGDRIDFSIDCFPGIQFGLVDTGSYYWWY